MRRVNDSYGSWDDNQSKFSAVSDMSEMMYPTSESRSHTNGHHRVPDDDRGPAYLLEHLATFTVSEETDIAGPRDGMRRLLQMEKTTGIWTQKMEMRLWNRSVVIVDHENGDLVERFPIQLIREPTAFTSNDPKELYNNIFIFVVAEDPTKLSMNPAEMHIFQCSRVGAQQVVEDTKAYISGKLIRPQQQAIPPPPDNQPPEPPGSLSVRQQMALYNGRSNHFETSRHSSRERAGSDVTGDDVSSTASEKYERDVSVLNHCFDDIEKFIARLQQAAVAARELDKRRKKRQVKKKDFGEGMLSMRAKAPPRSAFVEILQKFKLSFNLLSKLKAHIHDPNAPELVHFLFTPLALIVDAARDSSHGTNLPAEVVSPLLSRDAVDLLINCLTSKESELWHSLGEPWCRPRDQWKGHVAPYQPVFLDGWSPEVHEDRTGGSLLGSAVAGEAQRLRGDKIRNAEQEADRREHSFRDDRYPMMDPYYDSDQPSLPSPSSRPAEFQRHHRHHRYSRNDDRDDTRTPSSEREPAVGVSRESRSDSADSVGASSFVRQQRLWYDEVRSRGGRAVQVTYPRTANNDKELTVTRGEYLQVIDDSRKWWRVQNYRGQTGHVPHTIVTPVGPDDMDGASSTDWVKKERQGKKGEFRYI